MPGVYRSCTCLICLYYISKHQSVFICEVVLFVHTLYCFLYSFNLWFSYERFLCCWWPCCCFCFCLLQKALDTYHKLLFKVFFLTATWLPHGQLLGHYRGDSLTHPMLITLFYIFDLKVTRSLLARLGP